ncbi:MAG: preprotein translocase subunit SecA, partial [Alphaproteobacteria bacterium]
MFTALAERVFGSANTRHIKKLESVVATINALEPEIEGLDDAALKARTNGLRERHAAGESLDD